MKVIEIIFEIFGWLVIVLGTTIAAGLIAFLFYWIWTNDTVKIIGFVIISLGFLLGAIWATKIWKKYGTIAWLSGIRRIS